MVGSGVLLPFFCISPVISYLPLVVLQPAFGTPVSSSRPVPVCTGCDNQVYSGCNASLFFHLEATDHEQVSRGRFREYVDGAGQQHLQRSESVGAAGWGFQSTGETVVPIDPKTNVLFQKKNPWFCYLLYTSGTTDRTAFLRLDLRWRCAWRRTGWRRGTSDPAVTPARKMGRAEILRCTRTCSRDEAHKGI
jgi:hypothetical protein